MNLLKTDTYELIPVTRSTPRYAILSHRWETEEIEFERMRTLKPSSLRNPSFPFIPPSLRASAAKIRGACAIAQQQRIGYIWIDTCCIERTQSEPLAIALNSMFKWYQNAEVCYTFLNDVTYFNSNDKVFMSDRSDRRGQASEWFGRGWTLQELLAPRKMQFYDKRWKFMGTRNEHAMLIDKITGIGLEFLTGKRPLSDASCAMKMSWMAGRVTMQVEDVAYSLLGIFGIHMVPAYGEGTRAFRRLQDAIMAINGPFDESLFAWERPQDCILRCYWNHPRVRNFDHNQWGLLAPSPDCFKRSGNICVRKNLVNMRPAGGFRRSHQGIFFAMPSKEVNHMFGRPRNKINLPLNCWRLLNGETLEAIVLRLSRGADGIIYRTQLQNVSSQKGVKVGSRGSAVIAVALPQIAQY